MDRRTALGAMTASLAPLAWGVPGTSYAQIDYPARPIQIVTSFPVGMATDIVARIVGEKLGQKLGQNVVVVNKPGGGGVIATDFVAKAPPDGYTLLMGNATLAVTPFLYKKLPYDQARDFAAVALVAESPYIIVVNSELGVTNVADFIALAKRKPKTINYVSAGFGSSTHLAGALFAARAGIELVHVPYTSMSNITPDLLSNRAQVAFFPMASSLPLVRSGKMVALGASSPSPLGDPMNVPSVKAATGLDYIASSWNGLFAPARTPSGVLDKLASTLREILEEPEVKERLRTMGFLPNQLFLTDFDAYVRNDMKRWEPIVKATGQTLD